MGGLQVRFARERVRAYVGFDSRKGRTGRERHIERDAGSETVAEQLFYSHARRNRAFTNADEEDAAVGDRMTGIIDAEVVIFDMNLPDERRSDIDGGVPCFRDCERVEPQLVFSQLFEIAYDSLSHRSTIPDVYEIVWADSPEGMIQPCKSSY